MTKVIGRYPAQVIIFPTPTDITTIVSGLNTTIAANTSIVINRQDQLNQPVEVNIQEMYEPNLTQASNAPSNETKVGLTANAKVMLNSDKFKVFAKAFNANVIAGSTVNDPSLMQLSDDAGLTFGTTELPFYSVVIRPYIGANPTTNPELYVIFPTAGIKGDAAMRYSLGEQWGYSLSITAYPNPVTGDNKVLRGDTALLD